MVLWRLAAYWQMVCCHGNIAPKTSTYKWFRNSCPTHQSMQCKRCYHLTTLLRGYFRLKLSPTSGCCPWWLIFFKNLFYQKNYHILLAASYHGILRLKHNWMLPSSSGTSQNILKQICCVGKIIQQKAEKAIYFFLTTTFQNVGTISTWSESCSWLNSIKYYCYVFKNKTLKTRITW